MLALQTKDIFLDVLWNLDIGNNAPFTVKTLRDKLQSIPKATIYSRVNLMEKQKVLVQVNTQKRHVVYTLDRDEFQKHYGKVIADG